MNSEPNPSSNIKKDSSEHSETIAELAHRHLMNERHTTTDAELENARFEFSENVTIPEEQVNKTDVGDAAPALFDETA